MYRAFIKRMFYLYFTVIIVSLLVGCGSSNEGLNNAKADNGEEGVDLKEENLDLDEKLKTKKVNLKKIETSEGETFQNTLNVVKEENELLLDFTLENISEQGQTFTFSSGQEFDFWVYDKNNNLIYQWSDGRFFTMVIKEVTLDPGDQLHYKTNWDFVNQLGDKVSEDEEYTIEFSVTAQVKGQDETIVNPAELQIKEKYIP